MTRRILCVTLVALVAVACGGPTTPTDPLSQVSFTVDGQTYTGNPRGMSALDRGFGTTDILMNTCSGTSVVLSLQGPLAVGPHPLSRVSQAALFQSGTQWDWPRGQAPGSLTFTSVSPRFVGQFSFEVRPLQNPTGAPRVIQGSFDVSYGDGTVCQ
jgi:hypothetical protein